MSPKDKLTLWVAVIGVAIIALVFWAARASAETTGTVTVGELQPVGGIGNTAPPALTDLCMAAPLNSFGVDCEGISWQYFGAVPLDLRTAPVPVPARNDILTG